jgi:diguanylate cyclase (GGDEF)-like protein
VLRSQPEQPGINPLVKSIEAAFKRPFSVDGQEIRVTASLGLSRAPEHGTTTDALMQNADIALYEAKRRGRRPVGVLLR